MARKTIVSEPCDPRELLRELAAVDRRGAVWCAAQCARAVLHLIPVREHRPRRAVLVAEAWATGVDVPGERMRRVAGDASAATSYAAACAATSYAAASAAAYAASAADALAADVASAVCDAAAYDAPYDAPYDAWSASRARRLSDLHDLILGQTVPVSPTLADVRAARPGAQVAWDWLQDVAPEPGRVGLLSDALCRSRAWRLRWSCSVERALAERCQDIVIDLH